MIQVKAWRMDISEKYIRALCKFAHTDKDYQMDLNTILHMIGERYSIQDIERVCIDTMENVSYRFIQKHGEMSDPKAEQRIDMGKQLAAMLIKNRKKHNG